MAYILISIVALIILLGLIWFLLRNKNKSPMPLSPLENIAFILILFGIIGANVLSNSRVVGYGLIGAGLIVALIDIIRKFKVKK